MISPCLTRGGGLLRFMHHMSPGRTQCSCLLQNLCGQRRHAAGSGDFPHCPPLSVLARHTVSHGTLTSLKVPFSFLLVFIWFFLWGDSVGDPYPQYSSRKDGEYFPVPWSQCHPPKTFKLWGSFVLLEGLFYKDISRYRWSRFIDYWRLLNKWLYGKQRTVHLNHKIVTKW